MAAHKATTSLYGRMFGIQKLQQGVSKQQSKNPVTLLVGDTFGGVRHEVQAATSDTTAVNITGWGLTTVDTSTDDTWLLDPPIAGVMKMIYTGSTSTGIRTIKRKDDTFGIRTTAQSTLTTIIAQGGGIMLSLMGVSSAIYAMMSTKGTTEIALNGTT